MFDPKQIDDLTQKVLGKIPSSVKNIQQDVEKNIRAALQTTLTKMDLVSREEFDVQTAVLARTRAKLDAMEKQMAALEKQCLDKS